MNLQVGVKVVLRNPEGKILILKRSEEKYGKTAGQWDIVGGRIDPGTTLEENLAREVKEETNLAMLGEVKLIAAQDIIRDQEKHVVRLTYVGRVESEPKLDPAEHSEYKWVAFGELAGDANLDIYTRELIRDSRLKDSSWD